VLIVVFSLLTWIPASFLYRILFLRQTEKTVAESKLAGTYYDPWADEMLKAEQAFLANKAVKRVSVTAKDGTVLCGDLLGAGNRKLVIMFHGFMTAPTKNFGVTSGWFREAGYDTLLVHQRAHAPSGGKHAALGLLEREDVLDWVRWSEDQKAYTDVVIYGVSMGSTSVSYAASRIQSPLVKVLILDAGFTSPWIQLVWQARRWHIPHYFVMPTLALMARLTIGVDLRESVHDSLRKNTIPTLFLHGMDDHTVLPGQVKSNYEASAAPKQFIPVEGAEHTLALICGGQ